MPLAPLVHIRVLLGFPRVPSPLIHSGQSSQTAAKVSLVFWMREVRWVANACSHRGQEHRTS